MENIKQTIKEILGPEGRIITMSKSSYTAKNPSNLVVYNANMCLGDKKVWYGDIDISISREELQSIAKVLNGEVSVLREMDGRFENDSAPLLDRFVYRVSPDGSESLGSTTSTLYQITDLGIVEK